MSKSDHDRIASRLVGILPAFGLSPSYEGYVELTRGEGDEEQAAWHRAIWLDFMGFLRDEGGFGAASPSQVRELAEFISELYNQYGSDSVVISNLETDFFQAFAGWVELRKPEADFGFCLERFLTGRALAAYKSLRRARSIVG